MFNLTLRLEYDPSSGSAQPTSGWYLPSSHSADWLRACESLARAANMSVDMSMDISIDTAPESIRYYLAPTSRVDPTVGGLIALSTMARPVNCPPGAIPLVKLHSSSSDTQIWLPIEARLIPCVDSLDLPAMFAAAGVDRFVWLPPNVGDESRLVGLQADDEIDLSVLLRPPAPDSGDGRSEEFTWRAPPEAALLPMRLADVELDPNLVSQLAIPGQDDSIGNDAHQLLDLDDDGNLQGGGIGASTSRWFRRSLEKLVGLLSKWKSTPNKGDKTQPAPQTGPAAKPQAPATSKQGRAAKRSGLGNFFASKLSGMLDSQRDKQLQKLLKLMHRDPDKALKYALPLGERGAPRGFGSAGSKLARHDTDFSLAGLFGSRASDMWNADSRMREKLRAAYTQQAQRELAAGRYRRAAYIFAHLLGDYRGAASVLEKGKYYREAAELYEKLQDARGQARCLHLSGQTRQAAEIFERLGDYVEAARLWSSIDEPDKRQAAYQKAYEQLVKRQLILQAARMLEDNLGQPEEAEELLWQQWPNGAEILECITAAFGKLAASSRVREAQARFQQLVTQAQDIHQLMLAKLCVELVNRFPTLGLRDSAEDQCRVSVAHQLDRVSPSQLDNRMRIMRRLHPSDTLLHRDIRRFEKLRTAQEIKLQPVAAGSAHRNRLNELPAVQLSNGQPYIAKMIGPELFIVFEDGENLGCARYRDLGNVAERVSGFSWPEIEFDDLTCAYCRHVHHTEIDVCCRSQRVVDSNYLVGRDRMRDSWKVNKLSRADGRFLGIADDRSRWFIEDSGQLIDFQDGSPAVYDLRTMLANLKLSWAQIGAVEVPTEQASGYMGFVQGMEPIVATGRLLFSLRRKKLHELYSSPEQIRFIASSLPYTTPRVLVGTDDRLCIVPTADGADVEVIARDEAFLAGTFIAGGRVAAVTADELCLFHRQQTGMVLRDRRQLRSSAVVAVLGLTAETVGVLYASGQMQRWRIGIT